MNINLIFIFILYHLKFILLLSNEKFDDNAKKSIIKDGNYQNIHSNSKILYNNLLNIINNMIEHKYKNLKFSKILTINKTDGNGIYYFILYYHSQPDNFDENIYFLRCKAYGNINNLKENITVYEFQQIEFKDYIFPNEILEQQIKKRINDYHLNKYNIDNYKYNFIKKSSSDNFNLIRLESEQYGPHYYYYLLVEYEGKIRISFACKTPKYLIY